MSSKNNLGKKEIISAWARCYHTIESDSFKGWDPYDGLTTNISLVHHNYYTRLIFFYFNKFSAVNFRKLLGIPKREFMQTYMFLGLALLNLGRMKDAFIIMEKIIADSKISEIGFHCWDGLDMPIQMRDNYKQKGSANVISTELAARFILYYLKKTPSTEGLYDILESIEDYFLKKMLTTWQGHTHFKYYDVTPDELFVLNSNANICAFLAEMDGLRNNLKNKSLVDKVFGSILSYQHDSGKWNYNVNLKLDKQKPQVDFHQGFILDSILRIMNVYGLDNNYVVSYTRGLEYYYKQQFHSSGRSYYRVPKKWPVNIHNQVQGIITFTRAAEAGYGNHYLDFAQTIALWSIQNMQGQDGHFYYLKYPFFTNKIPYIRWNDSAMVYALAVYLNKVGNN